MRSLCASKGSTYGGQAWVARLSGAHVQTLDTLRSGTLGRCSTWDVVFWPASNKGGTARALPRTTAPGKMQRSKLYCLQASYQSGKHAAPRPDPRGHSHKAPSVAERSAAVTITGRRELLRLARRYCARADIVAQRVKQRAGAWQKVGETQLVVARSLNSTGVQQ